MSGDVEREASVREFPQSAQATRADDDHRGIDFVGDFGHTPPGRDRSVTSRHAVEPELAGKLGSGLCTAERVGSAGLVHKRRVRRDRRVALGDTKRRHIENNHVANGKERGCGFERAPRVARAVIAHENGPLGHIGKYRGRDDVAPRRSSGFAAEAPQRCEFSSSTVKHSTVRGSKVPVRGLPLSGSPPISVSRASTIRRDPARQPAGARAEALGPELASVPAPAGGEHARM